MELVKTLAGLLVIALVLHLLGPPALPAPDRGHGLVRIAAAAGMLGFMAYEVWRLLLGTETLHWRRTRGRVRKSWVSRHSSYKGGTSYTAHVEYDYDVGARHFESDRFTYRPAELADESDADRMIRDFPEGRDVDVFYDPARADHAVLVRGASILNVVRVVQAAFGFGFVLWLFFSGPV